MLRTLISRLVFPILILLLQAIPFSLHAATVEDIQASLLERLGQNPSLPFQSESPGVLPSATSAAIVTVYRENGFEPLWVDEQGPTQKASVLLGVLKSAANDGLDPDDYHASQISSRWHEEDSGELAAIDILLTTALHQYVSDIREGRLDPCLKDPDLFTCARDRTIDPVDLTDRAMATPDLKLFLRDQAPDNDQYRNLRKVLARYREIENNGGWGLVAEGPTLHPGMDDSRVPAIRVRLSATGHLLDSPPGENPLLYDDETVEGVIRFQKSHGLEADGIIGKSTRAAMNVPVSAIIRRILINMERLRWLSRGAGPRHVMVNIASFELKVSDEGETVLRMPVIVGKDYRETPVFSDTISYIEFNPYWNIPPKIAQEDIHPKLLTNPKYLADMGIRVFDGWEADSKELDPGEIQWDAVSKRQMAVYKLRQDPGPKNFLGRVKFMFPNRFAVYLHDTPSQQLFQRPVRTFSSGCIRLSSPVELAEFLLRENGDGWDMDRIRKTIDSGARTVVKLSSSVPIHIVYLTVFTDEEGEVCFRNDVYGRDAILENALFSVNTPA